ncbi:leucine-rich repeat-containing protein 24-like [Artemia franciscana]|uniref:leucine-rich repeat-containing protein 24-like n=1 Tax=Artemia franciscana TaxID=6661 RepID=UPI0032DAE740
MFKYIILMSLLLLPQFRADKDWTSQCPSTCKCKWMSGKRVAQCTGAGFTAVPNTLSSEVSWLDLSDNVIDSLPAYAFKDAGLENLQKIHMRNCSLRLIHKDAFKGLTLLVDLDLSNNNIKGFEEGTLKGNEKLRVFVMNNNPLRALTHREFPYLPSLRQLEMRNCEIEEINANAFLNLRNLEILELSYNKLKTASPDIFAPLEKLKGLNIKYNPWNCDCKLRDLRRFLLESNLYSNPTSCNEPERLYQKTWDQIEPEEFACHPIITVIDPHIEAKAGTEVTFSCLVSGNPTPETKWILNGRILANMSQIPYGDQLFVIHEQEFGYTATDMQKWTNLTVKNIDEHDGGIYTCSANNPAGVAEGNATLTFPASPVIIIFGRDSDMGLSPLSIIAISIGAVFFVLLIVIVVIFWVFASKRRRKRRQTQEKTINGVIGHDEHEKALLGTELTDLTIDKSQNSDYERLSQSDTRISVTYIPGEKYDELHSETNQSAYNGAGRLVPDLLDLPPRRGDSPSTGSGTSTAPDTTKLPQQPLSASQLAYFPTPKVSTLSHTPNEKYIDGVIVPVARPGYVTLPRRPRPRIPSWASGPVPSPAPSDLIKVDPIYDSVGPRTTADGSSTSALSLNRIAGLTPISSGQSSISRAGQKQSLPAYYLPMQEVDPTQTSSYAPRVGMSATLPRSTPNMLENNETSALLSDSFMGVIPPPRLEPDLESPMSRASIASTVLSVDGRKKIPPVVAPKPKRPISGVAPVIIEGEVLTGDSPRKVPPKPPPKPKKRLSVAESVAEVPEGFEDEGEDGTEV